MVLQKDMDGVKSKHSAIWKKWNGTRSKHTATWKITNAMRSKSFPFRKKANGVRPKNFALQQNLNEEILKHWHFGSGIISKVFGTLEKRTFFKRKKLLKWK